MITIRRIVIISCVVLFQCFNQSYSLNYWRKGAIIDNNNHGMKYQRANQSKYKYEIRKITVPVDHFSFAVNESFQLRYLVNDTWQKDENPPIFFYTGNEGWIEVFAENTGFMWDIAPNFGALLVFAEHRYYGESLPYGNKSYSDAKYLGYLNSQQALADYVQLIEFLKSDPKLKSSSVIAFGGSYGGMLSAWFRIKYPHIVQGAIAASAPILQFTDITDCEAFSRIVTSDFRAANPTCPKLIRRSWGAIANITSTEKGKQWLSSSWKLCKPLNTTDDINQFKNWLINIYSNLAMVDYPYESDFLAPLPAYPITEFCKHLNKMNPTHEELLTILNKAVNVYTNYTGKTSCLATEDASPDLGATGWNYQACTEMIMPMCSDGIHDMFEPQAWNLQEYSDFCVKAYNVTPKPYLACQTYGCNDLSTATNIVFSNGLLDPWSSGGVLRNLSQSALAIVIAEGAHHLDLRSANAADPYSVTVARKFHQHAITRWIREHDENLSK
ncbi:lysosomal Pro-X carboxypeptidase isoform X2 [Chelonus insularis]|nr:lysosomal Pro-X carboxypeptidase isoform X2 [Chelonus insularis]